MNQQLATVVYIVGIAGLFFLDREPAWRVSKGLWVPVLWLLIVGSRPVSSWFQSGPTVSLEQSFTDGSPIDAAIFAILILAGLIVLGFRAAKVRRLLIANIPILIFFAYCLISIAWSDYSFVAFKRWIKAIGDLVMVLVLLTELNPSIAVKRLFSRTAFILLPLSLLFIKYYPNIGRSYNPWTWTPMYSGVTTFKNMLGMTCLFCGIGSVWSFVGAYEDREMPHRFRHMIPPAAMIFLTIWLLLIADSMTSLSCLLMASTLIVLTTQKRQAVRTSVAHFLVAGCIVLSLSSLFLNPTTMLQSIGRDPTLTGRTQIWTAVLSMHTNPLLGTGFESFWMGDRLEEVWRLSVKGIQEAHDGYLEVYLNLGFAGLALLAIVIVTGYRNIFAFFRRHVHDGRLRLAFFTAGVIYSFTEAGFRMMTPMWIGFLYAVSCVPPEPRRIVKSPRTNFYTDPIEIPMEAVSLLNVAPGFPSSHELHPVNRSRRPRRALL